MIGQTSIQTPDSAMDPTADHLLPKKLRPQMQSRSAGNSSAEDTVKVA